MIDEIREAMTSVLAERPGAGRRDLLVLLHPDTRRVLVGTEGFNADDPDRIAGIDIRYTDTIAEGEFEIVWREG